MASGSMGMVYKAERVPVGKLVALKFLHKSFAKDSEFLARFERETRVMSRLAHPNCVSVLDFGVWKDSPYLVMDFVGGTTLRTLLDDKGALPPHRALGLARQILAGLAHAHKQDVIHRDIKPANIMITEEIGTGDHVRILDFGLARLRGAVGRDATQSNVVVGTPNYMAPEQTVGGGVIDARTDVYAVGVVLFEMLAGERPFHAEDTLALLGMHRGAPIPKLADKISDGTVMPDGIQKVLETAMAKSPGDRYQTAIEFADAIDEVAGGRADGNRSVPTKTSEDAAVASTVLQINTSKVRQAVAPKSSRGWMVLVLLAGMAAAGVWYFKVRPGNTPVPPASKPIAAGANVDAATVSLGSGSAVAAIADSAVPADSDVGMIDAAIDPTMAGSGDLAGSGSAGSGSGSA
ncbi:MAG: protein kinase, partial [Kofleriaceae bacterium]